MHCIKLLTTTTTTTTLESSALYEYPTASAALHSAESSTIVPYDSEISTTGLNVVELKGFSREVSAISLNANGLDQIQTKQVRFYYKVFV